MWQLQGIFAQEQGYCMSCDIMVKNRISGDGDLEMSKHRFCRKHFGYATDTPKCKSIITFTAMNLSIRRNQVL